MGAVAFDTLKVVRSLEASGMPVQQAEAVVAAVRDAADSADLVTRKDLQIEIQKLKTDDLAPMKTDIVLLKWMLGLVVAGVLALVMKAFLPF
jgi:hypothetical protein